MCWCALESLYLNSLENGRCPTGTIKGLTTEQVAEDPLNCAIILGNTYHLGNKPGGEVLETIGGLHKFMNWCGVI